jgi:signal transduction histidine kinase/ActR/RegA family two-component response regulator
LSDARSGSDAESALRASEGWIAAQNEALRSALADAPLETSLGPLIRGVRAQDPDLRCAIYLFDAAGTALHHVAGLDEDGASLAEGSDVDADSLANALAIPAAQPVIIPDVTVEPRWTPWLPVARALDIRACWSFPIRTGEGRFLGVLAMYGRQARSATPRDHDIVASLARTAALIIVRHQEREARERDVAQLRASHAQLEQANRAKDEFLAMLGHELRNPLQPIVSILELMRLRHSDALAGERAIIEAQVKHLQGMVDDMLDVARIVHGKLELQKAPQDLGDTILRAIEAVRPVLEESRQQIEMSVAAALVVDGDRRRLMQVFANLLGNAAKYSPPGSTIVVGAAVENGQATVRVRDSGVGIDPALRPHIFDMFTQDPQSSGQSHGGLGLGLSIVHKLVKLHGGSVEAHSEGRGHGSEFVVRLPLAGLRDAALPRPEVESSKAVRGRNRTRILIVDDYAPAADSLSELLQVQGFETRVARDGAEALDAAIGFKPTLALIDIGLPQMDGYELARRLRATVGLENLRLVALTGFGQAGDLARAEEAGFDAHLLKPVSLERLDEVTRLAGAPNEPRGPRNDIG